MTATEVERTGPSASVLKFRRLLERAAERESLEALLLTDAQRTLLRRSSIPRMFDRALVERVMLRDLGADPAATYDWLVAHDDTEPVSAYPGCHRVKEAPRNAAYDRLLTALHSDPQAWDEFRTESGHLAQALDRHDPRWESETIYHLAIASPGEAAKVFAKAYDAADAALDFSRCEHLLATLAVREELLAEQLQAGTLPPRVRAGARLLGEFLDDRERLFTTRRRFAEELRLSAHVLEREFMRGEAEALDDESPEWIVNLEAEGGRGKSAFINWFIARHAVPRRIPVAKVDFDNPEWSAGHHAPWEFLLHFAKELNGQLHGSPLSTLIDELTESRQGRVAQQLQQSASSNVRLNVALEGQLAEDSPARLGAVLQEATRGPVVLVLDTLEELSLRGLASLAGIVDVLAEVHALCPRIRLYLSGRFNLADRHEDMWARHKGAVRRIVIENFTREESEQYLSKVRGIRSASLVRAVATGTRGLPFQLSLIADLLQSRRELKARDIAKLDNLDLHYLVLRVLRRIERVEMRWLLRYGVVPKVLNKAFVRDVMLPDLRLAMAGASRHDDPLQDPEELLTHGPQFEAVLATPEAPVDVDALWVAMTSYASQCSFVSFEGERKDALVFHADVRRPMRRVLQRRGGTRRATIFERLHRRALDQARRDARNALPTDPKTWGAATARALYHAFQLSRATGEAQWDSALETVDSLASPEARLAIASELTLPEFVDDRGRPLTRGDESLLIGYPTLARAHLEKARACRSLAHAAAALGSPEEEWWARAEAAVAALDSLRRTREPLRLHVGTLAVLRAEIRGRGINAQDPATRAAARREARRILERARRTARLAVQRFEVDVALARLEADTDPLASITRYRRALERTRGSTHVTASMRREVLLVMAWSCEHASRYQEGIEALTEALSLTPTRARELRLDVLLRLAAMQGTAGDVDAAIATVGAARRLMARTSKGPLPSTATELSGAHRAWPLHAALHVRRREHAAALAVIKDGLATLGPAAAAGVDATPGATLAEQTLREGRLRAVAAQVHLARHELAAAGREIVRATELFTTAGDAEEASLLLATEMPLRLREECDVRLAESLAGKVESSRIDEHGAANVMARLAAIHVFDHLGQSAHADRQLQHLLGVADALAPRLRIPVLVRALVRGAGPARARLLRRLISTIGQITPARAGLRLLAESLQPGDHLSLTPAQSRALARAAALTNQGNHAGAGRPPRVSPAARIDEVRVALALRNWTRGADGLATIAARVRSARDLGWLGDVQELELDALAGGYAPEHLATPRTARRWRTRLSPGLSLGIAMLREGMLQRGINHGRQAREFAEHAIAALNSPEQPDTRWLALAHELLGDAAEEEATRLAARREAQRIYELRGDVTEQARLGLLARLGSLAGDPPAVPTGTTLAQLLASASKLVSATHSPERSPASQVSSFVWTLTERQALSAPGPKLGEHGGARLDAWLKAIQSGVSASQPASVPREVLLRLGRVTDAKMGGKPAGLMVTHAPVSQGKQVQRYTRVEGSVWSVLAADLEAPAPLGIPVTAYREFQRDWQSFCDVVGHGLMSSIDALAPARGAEHAVDVEIVAQEPILEAVPWELTFEPFRKATARKRSSALSERSFLSWADGIRLLFRGPRTSDGDRDHVRWVQRLLAALGARQLHTDGVLGPVTRQALREFQEQHRLEVCDLPHPPTVRRLVNEVARLTSHQRPRLLAILGESPATLWRSGYARNAPQRKPAPEASDLPYDVETIEQPTSDLIAATIHKWRPDVIHLRGVCRNATNRGGVVLDLSGTDPSAKRADRSLDASSLARSIGREETPLRPIVVVDAQFGSGESERVRALFLRNAFCGELAALGSASAVVALGFEDELREARSAGQLMKWLTAGHSIAGAVLELRASLRLKRNRHSLHALVEPGPTAAAFLRSAIQTVGVALWSTTPHDVFLPMPEPVA